MIPVTAIWISLAVCNPNVVCPVTLSLPDEFIYSTYGQCAEKARTLTTSDMTGGCLSFIVPGDVNLFGEKP